MLQSWFTPFLPRLEKTDTKLFDPSTLTVPEDFNISSFFFASFTMASTASLPPQFPELFNLFIDMDLVNPLNISEKCPIDTDLLETKICKQDKI